MPTMTCARHNCNMSFTQGRSTQIYCSRSCAALDREAQREPRIRPGSIFEDNDSTTITTPEPQSPAISHSFGNIFTDLERDESMPLKEVAALQRRKTKNDEYEATPCKHCGLPLGPHHLTRKYHPECLATYKKQQQAIYDTAPRICRCCGHHYTRAQQQHNKNAAFCSPICQALGELHLAALLDAMY